MRKKQLKRKPRGYRRYSDTAHPPQYIFAVFESLSLFLVSFSLSASVSARIFFPPCLFTLSLCRICIKRYIRAFSWHGPLKYLDFRMLCSFLSSFHPHTDCLLPLFDYLLPTHLPSSLLKQMWTQKKYLWMSGVYGHYGVSLLLASTLCLSSRDHERSAESRAVIMEIETPFGRCVRPFVPLSCLPFVCFVLVPIIVYSFEVM